jgi:hypothetical protein
MTDRPTLEVFSQAQLAKAVHDALATDLPDGHRSAIIGTVDSEGVQVVIGVQRTLAAGTFRTEFIARHDWTGDTEVGARVLYSW